MDFVEAVAGDVHPQLFKIASLPGGALGVRAELAALEEDRGDVFPLVEKIGIHAQLGAQRVAGPRRPEAERRHRFEIHAIEKILTTPRRRDRPVEPGNLRARREQRLAVFACGFDLARERETDPQPARVLRVVLDADLHGARPVFLQTHHLG